MTAANIQQQRIINDQLRREAKIHRRRVSERCKDMITYMRDHANEDYLLNGFPNQNLNPFREKSACSVL
ncbi:guanine nucleotide-binding protein subunit gamma-1-like [Musca vetustissima]|uniref:guanine nucleotide-binding protein subunit gamma-1-like n=1 Tax=Musca vetustissima TaxID=27455 RepID=UPI002AB78026|nr:guanine nucleotide-binding protein subunit gamma-1-like [Musca vetustissima]